MKRHQYERHYINRIGWLRAAVLGANCGIVSLSSLLVGVAATHVSRNQAVIVGVAGLVGGAMSMAAGEFVSVSSQADSERSDLERERRELESNEPAERAELAGIYVQRGLTPALASQVAVALMQHDALAAHARDELGVSAMHRARALLPLLVVLTSPARTLIPIIAGSSLLFLALLGALAARAGGAPIGAAALRVTFWGALAMAVTAAVGSAFGTFA